jgi:3-phenylpropionate/cinnamic acid dioxygenase small subunit
VALTAQQALWLELMPLYIREAWLLDERRLKEWLDLFTDDVLYSMPRRKNVPRREAHRELTSLGDLAILKEDKRYLEMRVARLDTGMARAEDPPSRTLHLIGNLEVTPLENGEVQVKTAFLVYGSSAPLRVPRGFAAQAERRVEGISRRSAWMPVRPGASHEFVHGSIRVRPQPANPAVSRVTTLAPRTRAIDAIIRSAVAVGRPALRRAAKISA